MFVIQHIHQVCMTLFFDTYNKFVQQVCTTSVYNKCVCVLFNTYNKCVCFLTHITSVYDFVLQYIQQMCMFVI